MIMSNFGIIHPVLRLEIAVVVYIHVGITFIPS